MKKHKMLITLAGLVAVAATSATITAYSLVGDGSDALAGESPGTYEPAFQDDKMPTDFGSDFGSSQDPALHGDPTYETWLKDNPPTDEMTDTPPLHGDPEPGFPDDKLPTFNPGPGQVSDDGRSVSVDNPDTGGGAIGIPDPSGDPSSPPLHGDPEPQKDVDGTAVPDIAPDIEPLEPGVEPSDVGPTENPQDPGVPAGFTPLSPTDDVEALDDQIVRVGPALGDLQDNLLATGAEVKVTNEVVSEDPFSVDGRILEVNGERVQVMDYGDGDALDVEAASISSDGSSVGTHMVTWVGPPHFFRTETAIVLYVGESPTVIEALTKMMGPQFAGR